MDEVIVFVRGGAVEDVIGTDDYSIVDYDNLEGGECPICGGDTEIEDIEIGDSYCPECKLNWSDYPSQEEIAEAVYRWRLE